jgi:NAD(P)-dependent dehydrogenase (short-subunit alcohol dehydrogenase family)
MKRVMITGANRGLGLELARQCAERGDRVFAGCRSPEKAIALEQLSTRHPGRVTILPLELTDHASVEGCGALVGAAVDGLDLLFNNAAIYSDGETIRTFREEEALTQLHVNAVGQLIVIRQFLGLLKAGEEPKIVNISSEAGSVSRMTDFRGYYYYASKAALNMLTRALAWDPEISGITVIAMHPGWVRTDMGGPDATVLPEESAAGILRVLEGLKVTDHGKFLTWEGIEYPW